MLLGATIKTFKCSYKQWKSQYKFINITIVLEVLLILLLNIAG
jgi:hypothetical protein